MDARWRRRRGVLLLAAVVGAGLYAVNLITHPSGWPNNRPGYWSVMTVLVHEARFLCALEPSLGAFLDGLLYGLWTVTWAVVALRLWEKWAGPKRWHIVTMLLLALLVVLPVLPTSRTVCPQM